MLIHKEPSFHIYFGDARKKFIPDECRDQDTSLSLHTPFKEVKKALDCQELVFLHQTHSDKGIAISSLDQAVSMSPFKEEGDFLMTHLSSIGIAVATADCLPIIIYDSFKHVVSVVHAGWRGSVKGIVLTAFEAMEKEYGSERAHLKIFFGPAAKTCCYEVQEDMLTHLEAFSFAQDVIIRSNGKLFLDVALLNRLQLLHAGFKKSAFRTNYNVCTMCDPLYCSFRRTHNKQRQMTVVSLR